MDKSSRKIVAIIAIFTLTVLAVMAGSFYTNAQNADSAAAVEQPAALNDQAEAAISEGAAPTGNSEFSSAVPSSQDIPAINGEPSMTFGNEQTNGANPPVNKGDSGSADAGNAVIVE